MQGRGKEILLLVLAVGALGVGLYTFRGKPAPAPGPEPTPAAPKAAGDEPAAEKAPGEGEEATSEEGADVGTAGEVRNPFSAEGGPAPETGEAVEGETGEAEVVQPPPGEQPAPTATGFKLEGIMTGPPAFAVIRYGDRPYFVRVGDEVGDGYRVEAIRGEREVVLVSPQGAIVLRTGKST